MKTTCSVPPIQQIKSAYHGAIDGSLFTTVLRNQIHQFDNDGEKRFSEMNRLWRVFQEYKKSIISNNEYFKAQEKLGDWEVLNSFKLSQSAYIHSVVGEIDSARSLLDQSMQIDLKLFSQGSFTIMICHYVQGMINHARLGEKNNQSSVYNDSLEYVLEYLLKARQVDEISIIMDIFGIQALIKNGGDESSDLNAGVTSSRLSSQTSIFSTFVGFDLIHAIRSKNSSATAEIFNLANRAAKLNPLMYVLLNSLIYRR